MGNIKTSFVKHIARDLLEEHGDKFTTDFEKNKQVMAELIELKSKTIRNVVAGYLTNLKRQEVKA